MANETMSDIDATWLHMDRATNPMVVTTVLSFDEQPDWDLVEQQFLERVVARFSRFEQRAADPVITFGLLRPRWVSATADDTPHIRRVVLQETDLEDLLASLASQRMDTRRRLWSVDLVDHNGGWALVLRTHHAIADGAGLVKLLLALAGDDRPATRPTNRGQNTLDPRRRAEALAKLSVRSVKPGSDVPLTGTKTVAICQPVPLEQFRDVRATTDSTINDIVLAAIAGGLRHETELDGRDPRPFDAAVPVSHRHLRADGHDELGNKFGLAFATLPVNEPEPLRRVAAVHEQMARIKASGEAAITFASLRSVGSLPVQAVKAWVDRFIGNAGAVVTNIVGPSEQMTLGGVIVGNAFVLVPMTGPIGLGVSVFSYADHLSIAVVADTATRDHVRPLALAIQDEITTLT